MTEFAQYQPECWQIGGVIVPIPPHEEASRPKSARQRFGSALVATAIAASLVLASATLELVQPWSSPLAWGGQQGMGNDSEAQVPQGYWDRLAEARKHARVLTEEFDDTSTPLI